MSEVDIKILDIERDRFGDGLRGHTMPVLHRTVELPTIAKTALDLAAKWGLVAAMPNGEDSAGRAKVRLLTPDEIAARACETAQALWMRFERLGWMVAIPDPRPREKVEKEEA